MQPTNIVRYSTGQNYYRRSSGFAAYGSMSLPLAEMAAVGEALGAADLAPPRDAMLITPLPTAMARLQRLHAAAGDLAETAPEILANPDAAIESYRALAALRPEDRANLATLDRLYTLKNRHADVAAVLDACDEFLRTQSGQALAGSG